ncbi:MAG: hypothetical protein NBV68_15785 [Erythrobacter sp.]|uniref:hypothetical protein n=1 Tax=Erythrobacter sp. TaxID=1042 RepID=UPI0025D31B8D|nr:hypothetical protein [Erythrobacter sp.]MCM0000839.1 hypothetical protein [Erythrobacter sp.]
MLKRIIGAAIGAKLAKNSPAVGGATGAALGAAVPFVLARISLPTMVMLGVGGYFAKRWYDKQPQQGNSDRSSGTLTTAPTSTPVQTYD